MVLQVNLSCLRHQLLLPLLHWWDQKELQPASLAMQHPSCRSHCRGSAAGMWQPHSHVHAAETGFCLSDLPCMDEGVHFKASNGPMCHSMLHQEQEKSRSILSMLIGSQVNTLSNETAQYEKQIIPTLGFWLFVPLLSSSPFSLSFPIFSPVYSMQKTN